MAEHECDRYSGFHWLSVHEIMYLFYNNQHWDFRRGLLELNTLFCNIVRCVICAGFYHSYSQALALLPIRKFSGFFSYEGPMGNTTDNFVIYSAQAPM